MRVFTKVLFFATFALTATGQDNTPGSSLSSPGKNRYIGSVQANRPGIPSHRPAGLTATGGHNSARMAASCSQINYPMPSGWTPANYYTGASVGSDGWINGVNVYQDKAKAMYFDLSSYEETHVAEIYVGFGRAYSANPEKIIHVRIYDGTSGSPGTVLGEIPLKMKQIMQDQSIDSYTTVAFRNGVPLPASGRIFVGVDFSNLQWNASVKDTLSIVSNSNGQTVPSLIWEQQSNNLWYRYGTAGSWNLSASLLIHPFLASPPPSIALNASATSVCEGMTLDFNAAGSTFESGIAWTSADGDLVTSDDALGTARFRFDTPGSHWVTLYAAGGGCSTVLSDSVQVTVNPNTSTAGLTASSERIQAGTEVTFLASVESGVTSPVFEFRRNGTEVQTSVSNEWKTSGLLDGDVIQVFVTSGNTCVGPSQQLTMQVQLPVKLIRFDVVKNESAARLIWEVTGEDNTSHYDIEAGTDIGRMKKAGRVEVSEQEGRKTYSFDDDGIYGGATPVYYRLRMEDNDGSFSYSPIISFYPGNRADRLLYVYPNPVVAGRQVKLSMSGDVQRVSRIVLYTQTGLLAGDCPVEKSRGLSFELPSGIQGGIYLISYYDMQGSLLETGKLVVN